MYHDNRFQNTSYNEFFVNSQTYKQRTKERLKLLKTFIRVVHDFAYVYISNFYIGHFLLVCNSHLFYIMLCFILQSTILLGILVDNPKVYLKGRNITRRSIKVSVIGFYNFKPSISQVMNSNAENAFRQDPIVRTKVNVL